MKREFSAGGIIFNPKGQVLLINNAAMRDPKKSYWGFPKGHIHSGESSQDAALREVEEEVGIKAKVLGKVGDSKYVFNSKEGKVFKVVIMYLMTCAEDNITHQTEELLGAQWLEAEDALEKLSFPTDKGLLKKAIKLKEVSP
ncbi:MAG: MutT/NUDIX family protein [uncultured bacterium]|uniref:MutT/nudix family protein n=3 Tax=Candidatus Daviesiibacteriota TaxID=1752718 RepID=A0A0G0H7F1_9BACT|nr:MAG: MutT/NUDIX family protein [uncultured bacterium]KKQ08019.1 MAG: MutT/nudix family protein [Candidatus Daviesbacteria bacterium GW2011_GWB1_36_5]KKQ13807.1 MAG: MutT/nudix family protein [Candidatus Daviesbacteria bacterium GW2011_GWA1_36_8]OGE33465.1 MAG: hypothetical protein A3C99_00185 [Candidatus Daviesbacteria bacterium RIFCSPHIGHO2_02_FULL_37_9]OGE35073.1 MAG: hypothetical protein A3E66_04625 [Candidatus Daviesbacteria bacterium RIFCSPHIGHO2_12_FULL_37_16]